MISPFTVLETKDGLCDRLLGSGHEQTANHYLISILVDICDSLSANAPSSCTADCTVNSPVLQSRHLSLPALPLRCPAHLVQSGK